MTGRTGGVSLGIDVGGTKMLAVAVDGAGEVVGERRRPTPATPGAIADALVDLVDVVRSEADRAGPGGVACVGVGVPGLVDRSGVLRFAPNLPGVTEFPVARLLAERTALPVRVDNDATCAAWAEHEVGAGAGSSDMVLVTLGTGIGGGIVAGGRVLRGKNGFAGELGHMVVERDGVPCPCGRRGCWERYASGSALGRMARDAAAAGGAARVLELAGGDLDAIHGEHVTRAVLEGDREALALLETMAGWLGVGLVNIVNAFDPELLVIGGGLVEIGEPLLAPARRSFAARAVAPSHRPEVPIVPASLGERAGAIGASLLAREG